jgi:hypothetical protein
MLKFLLAAIAGIALAGPAVAADLSVKAKPIAYPYARTGCYFGINTEAAVAKTDTSGTGLFIDAAAKGNLVAAGGAIGGSVGCIKGGPDLWYGVHADLDYQNITASVPVDGANISFASRIQGGAEVRLGGTTLLALLTQWVPSGSFPVVGTPATPGSFQLAATPPLPYVAAGFEVFQVNAAFGAISGSGTEIAPKLRAGVINQLTDATGKLTGAVMDTYAKVVFAGKGASFSDGQFAAVTNMGTQYRAGVAFYW